MRFLGFILFSVVNTQKFFANFLNNIYFFHKLFLPCLITLKFSS